MLDRILNIPQFPNIPEFQISLGYAMFPKKVSALWMLDRVPNIAQALNMAGF